LHRIITAFPILFHDITHSILQNTILEFSRRQQDASMAPTKNVAGRDDSVSPKNVKAEVNADKTKQ